MKDIGAVVRLGPAGCADLDAGIRDEWLLTDGLGGYAMGTAAGLRTRRYHGLLVVATERGVPVTQPGGVAERHLALAALDTVLVIDGVRHRLATDEWTNGVIDPRGHCLLSGLEAGGGTVRHRWTIGAVVVECEVAMVRGRPAVGVVHRVVRAPGPVDLEVAALGTWRDAHGERRADGPDLEIDERPDGVVVEGAWRVTGPGFRVGTDWYRGVRYREEAARGLDHVEDLRHVATFGARLAPGGTLDVVAWAGYVDVPPVPASVIVADARIRATDLLTAAGLPTTPDGTAQDVALRRLVIAADQHITAAPAVIAGYPWFGEWSRDTMTSYEGLFLSTGRVREGAALLRRYAATVSEGMLANTADTGVLEYNTVDATLWFVHAVDRHLEVTGDLDLAAELLPTLRRILAAHITGTRYGIGLDPYDGLLRCGAAADPSISPDIALTWMDARIAGIAVTPRHGKPVEVNALWVNALSVLEGLERSVGAGDHGSVTVGIAELREHAAASFRARFVLPGGGLRDVVDLPGPAGLPEDDDTLRPNQLLAVSLPHGPLAGDLDAAAGVVRAVAPLVTPLGMRTLAPDAPGYHGRHRGSPEERDHGYHSGTVWPWLIGPYVSAVRATGLLAPAEEEAILDGLTGHLAEAGLGSICETADGDAPHGPTGCPFQAWSVAELLRLLKRPVVPRAGR